MLLGEGKEPEEEGVFGGVERGKQGPRRHRTQVEGRRMGEKDVQLFHPSTQVGRCEKQGTYRYNGRGAISCAKWQGRLPFGICLVGCGVRTEGCADRVKGKCRGCAGAARPP